jgi:hypothetical protein
MPKCSQCDRQAIWSINGANVCVWCYARFEEVQQQKLRHLMAVSNQAADEMGSLMLSLGVRTQVPQYQIPPPAPIVRYEGPMTFHNINVQGGVIGAINTGNVKTIDVVIGSLNQKGDPNLGIALKELTEAVLKSTELQDRGKQEILEQLSFLSTQTTVPKDARQHGMIASVLDGISKAVSASTALLALWQKIHPLINHTLQTL